MDRLGVAEAREPVPQAITPLVLRILPGVDAADSGQGRRNLVQPHLTQDFLEEILAPGLARRGVVAAGLEVDFAPGGHRALPDSLAGAAWCEAESAENALDLPVRDRDAGESFELRPREPPVHRRLAPGTRVDRGAREGSARELRDERRAAQRRLVAALGIGAALEAVRGIGVQRQPLCADADAPALEVGALEQDVGRPRGHFRRQAAHDAGEPDGARAVGDDQHLRVELALPAVEGRELLAGARPAHPELAPGDRGEIVGVERLAGLPKAIVGGVDDVVDRTRADRLEAAHQPLG